MGFKSWSFKRKLAFILSLVLVIDLLAGILLWQLNKSSDSPLAKLATRFTDSDSDSVDKFTSKGNQNIVSACSKKLDGEPDNVNALSDRCEAYYFLGEYALAAKDAAHLNKVQPDNYLWVKWQAMAEQKFDPQQAIPPYNRLIKMDGAKVDYLLGRATCYAQVGQKALCLKDLQTIKSSTLAPEQILILANAYLQAGESKKFVGIIVDYANTAGGDLHGRAVNNHCLYRYLLNQERVAEAVSLQRRFTNTLSEELAKSPPVERNLILGKQYKVLADLLLAAGQKNEAMSTYQKAYAFIVAANNDKEQVWERYGVLDFGDLLQELQIAQILKTPGLIDKSQKHVVGKAREILASGQSSGYTELLELITALSRPARVELCDAALQYLERVKAQGDNFERDKIELAILSDRLGEARRAMTQIDPYAPGAMKNVELYLALDDPETALVVARGIKENRSDKDQLRAARAEFVSGNFEQAKELCIKVKGDPGVHGEDLYTLSRLAEIQKESKRAKLLVRAAAGVGNQQALLDLLDTKLQSQSGK